MKLEPLSISDYAQLKPYFNHQRYPLCAYSLPSILVWQNELFQPHAYHQSGALIIAVLFNHRKEARHMILPISSGKEFSPNELHNLARELDIKEYRFVPDQYLSQYSQAAIDALFIVEEEAEYSDYVYCKSDMAGLPGNRYSKKRNLIHQFDREYLSAGRAAISSITPDTSNECIEFLEKWCKERDCGNDPTKELACEKMAAIHALQNIADIGMEGIFIRVDGEICAFGIASHLTEEMGVLHFEKAFSHIKGLYQVLDRECARRLFPNYQLINKESDMGIPGLAKAKESYYPIMRIKANRMTVK